MAAKPEDRLVVKLLATSAVTALVVDRIVPMDRVEETALPCITYQRISTNDYGGLNTVADAGWCRVQMDCWAEATMTTGASDGAWALAVVVKTALNGLKDATGTPKINYVRCLDENEIAEPVEPGRAVRVHRIVQDYRVEWYT